MVEDPAVIQKRLDEAVATKKRHDSSIGSSLPKLSDFDLTMFKEGSWAADDSVDMNLLEAGDLDEESPGLRTVCNTNMR